MEDWNAQNWLLYIVLKVNMYDFRTTPVFLRGRLLKKTNAVTCNWANILTDQMTLLISCLRLYTHLTINVHFKQIHTHALWEFSWVTTQDNSWRSIIHIPFLPINNSGADQYNN